jgi:hypothetical protein
LYIAGRAADDLKHVAGRGLVFERLVTLGSALGKLSLEIRDRALRIIRGCSWHRPPPLFVCDIFGARQLFDQPFRYEPVLPKL